MAPYKQECKQGKRAPRPLDAVQLRDMALAYMARYATSAAKLERYLARKLRERGWDGAGGDSDDGPDIAALVARYVAMGYIDDGVFARQRGSSLSRRGYGARRVHQVLAEAGVAEAIRYEVTCDEATQRRAALLMARKRRLGPFGAATVDGLPADRPVDRAAREKQIATMLRAGHTLDMAREMVNAASIAAAEQWAAELDGEGGHEGW
jgi:regulatory protein